MNATSADDSDNIPALGGCGPEELLIQLRRAVAQGDGWDEITRQFGSRLRAMIQVRMQPRIRGRVDPSDVLQETYLEASRRLSEYLDDPRVPFYVWLRSLAAQRLVTFQRRHLGAQARNAYREVSLPIDPWSAATSAVLADNLIGQLTTPSAAAVLAELRTRLEAALEELDEMDREILVLRHFEELTNAEAAAVLGLKPSAACNRYVRALGRIKGVLGHLDISGIGPIA